MYIHEAINARTVEMPFITREKWQDIYGRWASPKIMATSSPDGMQVFTRSMKDPRRGWQPLAEDLTANDWITVG